MTSIYYPIPSHIFSYAFFLFSESNMYLVNPAGQENTEEGYNHQKQVSPFKDLKGNNYKPNSITLTLLLVLSTISHKSGLNT